MTDFETHPAGTADLVKRLREKQICTGFEQVEPGVIDCVYGSDPVCQDAADRIEQLEAENKRLGDLYDDTCYYHTQDGRAQFHARKIAALEPALTRANAATAAAYEVAAQMVETTAYAIRALATPDQSAALDKLIAEAVGPYLDALTAIGDLSSISGIEFKSRHPELNATLDKARQDQWGEKLSWFAHDAILAASKKGGV